MASEYICVYVRVRARVFVCACVWVNVVMLSVLLFTPTSQIIFFTLINYGLLALKDDTKQPGRH